MKNKLFYCILIIVGLINVAKADIFKADEFYLDNGLQVVVVENHKAPLVKHMMWYKVGAVDEYRGKGGSAHLLEHLMFRGTHKISGNEFNRLMEQNGALSNAFTSYDVTVYHQFADISRLELLMALEADRMHNLSFSPHDFEAEKNIVLQERKQVVENNPAFNYNERLNLLFWGNSPYGQPITGLPEEIEALTYNDTMNFYHKYYAPNNAILIISGDIDVETAKQLAEKYYGKIAAKELKRAETPEIEDKFSTTLQMSVAQVTTPKIDIRYMLEPHKKLGDKIYDYMVLAEYLGGGSTSELYKELVLNKHIAVTVYARYHFASRTHSVFSIDLLGSQPFAQDEVLQNIEQTLKEARHSLTNKRLTQLKRKMTADLIYMNDNPEDAADWIGYMLSSGFTLSDVLQYEKKIQAVKKSDVLKAFDELLSASKVIGILLPQQGEQK